MGGGTAATAGALGREGAAGALGKGTTVAWEKRRSSKLRARSASGSVAKNPRFRSNTVRPSATRRELNTS